MLPNPWHSDRQKGRLSHRIAVRSLSLLVLLAGVLIFVFLPTAHAGLLPPSSPYIVTNGVVEGQAEDYHAKSPSAEDTGWREIPTNAVVPSGVAFENATGTGNLAMQVPNVVGSSSVDFASGPSIDYNITFVVPGTYRLYLRWDGYDASSDSIYAGFATDAAFTGILDWYEDYNHTTSDFSAQGWDGSGQSQVNIAAPAQNPMTVVIPSSGTYTLRVVAREDGVALDSFRIQLASMIDPNPVAVSGQNAIFGQDSFTYANGAIAGKNGGTYWDFDNTTNNNAFIGYTHQAPSTWDTVFGAPTVTGNALVTQDSAAKREYNASEVDGVVNPLGSTRYKTAYYRVKMTRAAGATWSGLSVYDFNNERIFFGVQDAVNPSSGVREFIIGEGGVTYTGVPVVDGTDDTLVAKLDFLNDRLSFWINPDLTQPEGPPNATRTYTGDNWMSAVRLGSGGTAATTWDDVAVGSSWGAMQKAYPQSTAATGPNQIIAREDFDYDNGNIVGSDSGIGWDFDNQNGDAFVGRTELPSNWDNAEGWPYIFSKRLTTWNSAAKREYNSTEANGSFSNAVTSEYKTLYYRFEMQRSADNVSWSGLSLYDGNNERLMFGVPFALNPANSRREFGIHNLGANQWNYTGIAPVAGTKYHIIAKVDYTTGFASLYVNPSLTGGEPASPNATLAFTNAHSALRFGSGGDSPTYWDKLTVGTSWNAVVGPTYPAPVAVSGADLVIGTDTFTYSDGPIALQNGGAHWDYQNTFGPAYTNDSSAWSHEFNSPYIVTGKLRTWDAGALRTFNGIEADGAINDADTSAAKAIYVRYEMQRDAGVSWGGMSLYDFGNERFLFGVPFAINPMSGEREFAIHDLASGHTYSGIVPTADTNYTIVAKLDFVANKLVLWVNPDLTQLESSNTPAAERDYTAANWITAVRLASSADGDTQWDNLAVTTSWRSLQSALGAPTAFADAITMRHTKKALLDVRKNDAGVGSVVIVTPPNSGNASVDSAGCIFYEHTTGTPASDSLIYKLVGANGESAPVTVTYTFTSALRIANDTSTVPLLPPTTGLAVVDSTPGINFNAPSCMTNVPGSPNKILVGERNGKIWLINDIHSATPNKTLFIDLAAVVNARTAQNETFHDDGNELGLKGLALHPQFAANRQFFVTYNFRISGAMHARVSRFTAVNGNLDLGDAASEQPFITQPNPSSIHNIDSCRFGPDGYFYWAAGDAGGLNDGNNNAQRIDKDFWGGIFRIDVDRLSGNAEPNAHASIVLNGGTAYYKVPANNPFIGATTFNGLALTGTLRTELFAIGMRNPWQFSFDPQNGEMWAGEVGLDSWEEVNIVTPGGNFGWSYLEGTAPGTRTGPPVGFAPIAPLWTYFHGGGVLEGRSVTGGLVYRGGKYPALTGKYIFGDFVSGHIWSLTRNGANPPTVERITGEAGVVAFMLDPDPANGDILMLDYGDGKVRRLVSQTVDTTFPAKLSDTGLFSDLSDLSFNPGIERYDINLPFWSDYAIKSRWFMLPNDTDTFGYVQDGNWSLPEGALFIKHFDYELTRGNPVTKKRLETRLLMINATGSYGVSYRWNDEGTEAFLVADGGEDFDMNVVIGGTPTNVHWRIPSRSECLACHTPAGGHGLSFETRQLNRSGTLGGASGNYLELLANAGYLSNAPTQFHTLPKFHTPTDTSATLETRARSWLAVNCSYCHQSGGTGIGAFDLRPELSLTQSTMIDAHVGNVQQAHHKALVRGDNTASVIWNRLSASGGYTRMPPLATAVIDPEGTQVVLDWINSMASRQTYTEWRLAQFGSAVSPEGLPTNDADGDGILNQDEFLALTDPEDAASILRPGISVSSGNVALQFPNLQGRRIQVQTTTDFTSWSLWNVPGNDGSPSAPSNPTRQFVVPLNGQRRFFRLSVEEQ